MIFFSALLLFKNIVIFANACVSLVGFIDVPQLIFDSFRSVNDKTVPYISAAIETEDPFLKYQTNGLEV